MENNWILGNWINDWLQVYVLQQCAKNTYACYFYAAKRLFKTFPALYHMPMMEIKARDLQQIINSLESSCAKSSINHIRTVLSRAFQAAYANGFQGLNPANGLQLPRNAAEKTVYALTRQEEAKLYTYLPQEYYGSAIELILHTGLRRGELAALKWQDYRNGWLTIRQSKTKSGIRAVPLIPEAIEIVNRQWLHCHNSDYIFTSTLGTPITSTCWNKLMSRVRTATGIDHFSIHVLRHTFATRAVEAKIDYKALATIIGHKDVRFTMQRYVTAEDEFLREQIMLLSKAVSPDNKK
ncbi:MAG: site-specific integrase [Oscillospiraceae bacterium]